MKTFTLAVAVSFACIGMAVAQTQDGLKQKTHVAVSVTGGPVTQGEAEATFARMGRLFNTVLGTPVPAAGRVTTSNAPVGRSEVVAEFLRLYRVVQPKFKMTMRDVSVDVPRLKFDNPSLKDGTEMLIRRGCLAGYGPLVTGPVKTISVPEFGDAVGFFIARIAEMTHTPSTKWTPYLHGFQ